MRNLLRNITYAAVLLAAVTVTICELERPAGAQGGGRFIGTSNGAFAFASNGDVFQYTPTPGGAEIWSQVATVPGVTSPPVAMYSVTSGYKFMCQNGDVFFWGETFPGVFVGNVFGASGPVTVEPTTWSAIKTGPR